MILQNRVDDLGATVTEEQKIPLNEPSPGIVGGLLSDIWSNHEKLPALSGPSLIWYFLVRGFQTAIALPMSNIITVLTLTISLFLFGGFLLAITNIDKIISDAGGLLHVTVYLKDGAPEEEVNAFIRELEQNRSVIRSANYVSKAQALDLFRKDLGSNSGFLVGLERDNPLPASVDLVLQPDELRVGKIDRALENLRGRSIVEEVVYGSRWVERVQQIMQVFRFTGFIALMIVLAIIVLLIANTIKLVIYSRRDEIAIMQLVGAPRIYVELPFAIAGTLQGLVGSLLAILCLYGTHTLIEMQVRDSVLFGVALPKLVFLGPVAAVGVLFLGAIIGGLGSFFALGRFTDV